MSCGTNRSRTVPDKTEVHEPAYQVVMWLEPGSAVHLKAVSGTDPVELNAEEARAVAAKLLELDDQLDRD